MANHGSKFVSVNLNKSYGQQHQPSHHTHYTQFNGPGGAGRGRAGGRMLVLSRARGAAPKVGPKLSAPPPLNLPSLRKEHEKSDMLGPGGPGTGAGSGSGSRPNSSGMGWTKHTSAATTALPEKTENHVDTAGLDGSATSGASRGSGSYMPPSARFGREGVVGSVSADYDILPTVDNKAVLLRGEDFPSLQAARPVSSGTPQKQKDGTSQKQKHLGREEMAQDKLDNYHLGPLSDKAPLDLSFSDTTGNRIVENGGKGHGLQKKEDFFQDPLPLVRMNPRSNWADDERDTGHGFMEHGRDITDYANSESYWDRDFDLPRPSMFPHKPAPIQYGRWGQRDNETGKKISSEVLKMDLYSKDTRASSQEGKEVNKWRNSPPSGSSDNMAKENKYGDVGHNRDTAFGRRDLGFIGHQQQQRNNADRNIHHVTEHPCRYRGDNFQTNNNVSKSSFASGGKMHHTADPILNIGRDKRYSNSDSDYGDTGFDERDLFSEGLVGVIKRKKDTISSTHFHDPVRESFEAELERVQKIQELERQRVIKEQERALEQARREEDERHRRIREEEERRRKVEEEARETAWRAEQERIEANQKAEEIRIAREEEKKRIQLEEERRKLAAKHKLEELEARMAMRQAETSKMTVEEKPEVESKEKLVSKNLDLDTWEDSERMVESVLNSGSFDLSSHSTTVEMSSRPYPPREGSSNFADRGKTNDDNNSRKRDLLIVNGGSLPTPPMSDLETGHYSPRRDAFGGGRANPRKEFYGGAAAYMPSRGYLKPTMQEPYPDEFGYHKDQRWNSGNIADSYGKFREMDSEFHDGIANRYGGDNSGWGQGRPRVNALPPYPERLYANSEGSDLYNNYGRSRYSMRQPRVLPPPSLVPSQRPNNPRVTEHAGPSSAFVDNRVHYAHTERTESSAYYGTSNQGGLLEPSEIFRLQQENNNSEDKNLNDASRCDSQSSLSVSSPPTSPPHLSHDELDESVDARVTSSVVAVHNVNSGLMVSDNISSVEDEEWIVENGDTMQQQEEYDEDEDGYREEDEVRERDDENLELTQNFERLELEEAESPHAMENVVLGFDEGVEVVLPNDDFEKSLEISESSVGIVEERGVIDGSPSDKPNVTNVDEKSAPQGCSGQHVGDSSNDTVLAAQQITSSTAATSQAYINMPSLSSSSGGQADVPVKLQFGLFSGPSLIPSPVPAIQIGSIQMPLHIHPPVGQSMAHMHPSQPPMFQFGQLRYTSPISQGILPMGPQSMSFLHQPNLLGHFNIIHNDGGSVTHEPSRENETELPSFPKNNSQQHSVSRENPTNDTIPKADRNGASTSDEQTKPALDEKTKPKSCLQSSKSKTPDNQSQSVGGARYYSGRRGLGPLSGGRGKRFAYAVKNTNMRVTNVQDHDRAMDPSGIQRRPRRTVQRTEFRVRENYDRKPAAVSFNNSGFDENNRSNYSGKAVGVFMRSGSKRSTISNRTIRPVIESEPLVSGNATSQEVSGDNTAKNLWVKSQSTSHPGEASLRRNASEEDVDAPLQSGVVRVFKQPGIEAPSDEDDFIEVRSKRQMLNDRREQREKEMKAKSQTTKPPRKPRVSRPKDAVSRSYNKHPTPLTSGQMKSSQLDLASENPRLGNNEVSTGYTIAASQPPIATPPFNTDAQSMKSTQAGSASVVSNEGKEHEPGVMIDSKNKVMSLSQSQIDEAMKPSRYDSHIPTVGGNSSTVSDPILPTPSILTKDKTLSSGASPINSLLAGEKIQFGAVTSPTVLSSSRVMAHGIGAPGSNRPDPQMDRSFPKKEDSLFFSKEKQLTTDHVQDCEAEAEAAASAVAVAAISSDETVGNELGSLNDTKSSSAAGVKGMPTGVVSHQHLAMPSQSEELLSVSLPADLSVETTPISMWQPLPSPQGSSSQMLSHFPAGLPSHFPFYEMNPLLGGPIFAFNPNEESSSLQSQPQKSTALASGPLGNWPQCHSGVDSYYGAPSGYSGPFIGPPGGMQGPPHMVVYNHFAPVGQYGQVGLSFMGTTYIPSGKQVDWKNNAPASSVVHNGEGDSNNVSTSNVHRSGPSMTGPIQHLAPGSPLLPMPPPMPMFDVSPFQTASDLPPQARWGHIPASPLHPVPVSRPSQPKIEGTLTANRFVESRAPSNNNDISSFTDNAKVVPFPSQLGLADSSVSVQTSSESSNAIESSQVDTGENSKTGNAGNLKTQLPKKNMCARHSNNNHNTTNNNNGGYGYQRGVMSHNRNNNVGNEFSHRRMGHHGRNQSGGMDKGFHASKVKQIYVAKQTTSGRPAT